MYFHIIVIHSTNTREHSKMNILKHAEARAQHEHLFVYFECQLQSADLVNIQREQFLIENAMCLFTYYIIFAVRVRLLTCFARQKLFEKKNGLQRAHPRVKFRKIFKMEHKFNSKFPNVILRKV